MKDFSEVFKLKAERPTIESARVDLTRCKDFAEDVVRGLEENNLVAARTACVKAEWGYQQLTLSVPRSGDGAKQSEIEQGIVGLRRQLDELQNKFPALKFQPSAEV